MARYESILDAIGNTPLVRLNKLAQGIKCKVYAKLEYLNPGGSVKDRIAVTMVADAEKEGRIKNGATIIESTSGNTGAGLSIVCAVKNYKAVFTVNDKQSRAKINMLKAFGAEVIVCPTAVPPEDPRQYVQVAKKLEKEIPNSLHINQYDNSSNPRSHYETTGPEIWNETGGKITHFVCGMGTGGTISGVGKFLKEKNPKVKIIGVDPVGSLFYDFFHTGKVTEAKVYKVEGVGEDFFPKCMDFNFLDDVIQVSDRDYFIWTRKLARQEGIFAGGSSGGAVFAALKVARDLPADAVVVVLLPDSGMRYLDKVFNDEWMRENQYLETEIQFTVNDIIGAKKIRKLMTAKPADKVLDMLKLMRDNDVSQIPVLDGETLIGTVYEDDIVNAVLSGKNLKSTIVREVMQAPLPVVSRGATLEEVSNYIPSRFSAVLVDLGAGEYEIITKYDFVNAVGKMSERK